MRTRFRTWLISAALVFLPVLLQAQTGSVMPSPRMQFMSADGTTPCSGCKLYPFQNGTSSPQATYTDAALTSQHAHPIVLDAAGRPPSAAIYLSANTYTFRLDTASNTTIWTQDAVSATHAGVSGVTNTGDLIFQVDTDNSGSNVFSFRDGLNTERVNFNETGDVQLDDDLTIGDATAADHDLIFDGATQDFYLCHDTSATALVVGRGSVCGTTPAITLSSAGAVTIAAAASPSDCYGRITLNNGTPVTVADVLAATAVRFNAYKGNTCPTYSGTAWVSIPFSDVSLALGADAADTNYDLFLYDNAGTLTLERLAWTNDTTRATALTTQDGVLVKTGATTRRYLGTYRTTGVAGQTEDSFAKRYVWNYYNRVPRLMRVIEATNTWEYMTATWRQANGAAGNQIDFVLGWAEESVSVDVLAAGSNSGGARIYVAIGEDSTSSPMGTSIGRVTSYIQSATVVTSAVKTYPTVGRHRYVWLEYSTAAGTTTWIGDDGGALIQSGIHGVIHG